MNIFKVLCAVSPPQNESPDASNFMCIVPTLVITSELEYSSHLVYSVVSPAQLVSSSVALPAKLVFNLDDFNFDDINFNDFNFGVFNFDDFHFDDVNFDDFHFDDVNFDDF